MELVRYASMLAAELAVQIPLKLSADAMWMNDFFHDGAEYGCEWDIADSLVRRLEPRFSEEETYWILGMDCAGYADSVISWTRYFAKSEGIELPEDLLGKTTREFAEELVEFLRPHLTKDHISYFDDIAARKEWDELSATARNFADLHNITLPDKLARTNQQKQAEALMAFMLPHFDDEDLDIVGGIAVGGDWAELISMIRAFATHQSIELPKDLAEGFSNGD